MTMRLSHDVNHLLNRCTFQILPHERSLATETSIFQIQVLGSRRTSGADGHDERNDATRT